MFEAFCEVEGEPFGQGSSDYVLVHGSFQAPCSYAFFCPQCGRIWANYKVKGQEQRWMAITAPCAAHSSDSIYPSGSMWMEWDKVYLESLPREVLLREFSLHYNWFKEHA